MVFLFSDKTCLCTNLHTKNIHRGKGSGKWLKLEIKIACSEMDETHKHAKYEETQHRHDRLQTQQKINTETQSTEFILIVFHVSEFVESPYHVSSTILH